MNLLRQSLDWLILTQIEKVRQALEPVLGDRYKVNIEFYGPSDVESSVNVVSQIIH